MLKNRCWVYDKHRLYNVIGEVGDMTRVMGVVAQGEDNWLNFLQGRLGRYHVCWCPCFLCHQVIRRNFADYAWTWARFLSVAWSKLRLCSANHRAGYWSNLACDWLSIVWAYSEQETENGPWFLFHKAGFQIPVPPQHWERIENANIFAYFRK